MRADGVADFGIFLVFLGEFHAQNRVRQLLFFVPYLTDIVEQTGPFCQFGVQAQFRRHGRTQFRHFARVLEQVLSVARPETHPAHHLNQFGMQPVDSQVNHRTFADLNDFVLNIFAGFRHNFLNPGGVNPAILYQAVKRQTRNFAADRVKARNNDGLWCIINDDFDAGSGFEGPDVPAFTANDFAFNVVRFDVEDRYAVFNRVFGGGPLNRFDNYFPWLLWSPSVSLLQRYF